MYHKTHANINRRYDQYEIVRKTVKKLGMDIEVEYITDMEKVMSYGVMNMPAIVINGKVVSSGKVLNEKGVQILIE